jgi:signal transduction histidine kinase
MRIQLSKSSSFTLAVVFMAVLGVSVATLLYFMHLAATNTRYNEIRTIIATDMQGLLDTHRVGGLEGLSNILEYRLKNVKAGSIYALVNSHRAVTIGNFAYLPDNSFAEDGFVEMDIPSSAPHTGLPNHQSYRILSMQHPLGNGHVLMVGRNIPDIKTHTHFIDMLGWSVIAILVLITLGAFFIGDRVVYRINLIADTAGQIIATGDLSRRIPVVGNWDDLSKLTSMLNVLLDRIEHLMESVRQVSDNIAHDLRTPLTRMRNHIETLRDYGESHQLGIEACTDRLLEDVDHLLLTFSALLRIGNVESGRWRTESEMVALEELVHDVIELYEPLALERHQNMTVSLTPFSLQGDKHLLFQAVANMVDNAIKYAPDEATISIAFTVEGQKASLSIHNTGSHVDGAHIEKLFQRFYRADSTRELQAGTGLGLSLVKAIIELHHGTVTAENTATGFCLTCHFPMVS